MLDSQNNDETISAKENFKKQLEAKQKILLNKVSGSNISLIPEDINNNSFLNSNNSNKFFLKKNKNIDDIPIENENQQYISKSQKEIIERCKVIFSYETTDENELTLHEVF